MMANYSVLMSVYQKEQAEFLQQSIESILSQTVPTDDFVLVCDGPLTEALDAVITQFQISHSNIFHVHRLPANRGLHHALNWGLKMCKNELVARMDSDDIAPPGRCALQLQKFEEDPQLVIVGGAVDEFEDTISNTVARKSMPESAAAIRRYARRRNPFNHPTVMYRKSAVLAAGSYPNIPLHEDYALWVQLLHAGAKSCNLPDTLCHMRVSSGLYDRRGGWAYFKKAAAFRYHLYHTGFSSLSDFLLVTTALVAVCMVPSVIRRTAYRTILRK